MSNKVEHTPHNRRKNRWPLYILCATNIVTLGVIVWLSYCLDLHHNRFPLLDISRNVIEQEDFIINIQPLREKLGMIAAKDPTLQVSLYYEFLNTGANISINKDLRIWPASLPKVPMAVMVMKKVEDGEWSLTQEMVIQEEDRQDRNSGELWRQPAGTRMTVEALLRELLVHSDNTAHLLFLRQLDADDIPALTNELGLEEMFTPEGQLSAKEYSRVFRSLYTSSYLKRANSERILEWLAQSPFKEYLAFAIPADVPFAHKFGMQETKHAYLDSGIVYVKHRPYLLTVAIQGIGEPGEPARAKALMHEISTAAYDYITSIPHSHQ